MTVLSQSSQRNPYGRALLFCLGASSVAFLGLLRLFGVPLVPFALASGLVFLLWLAFRYPMMGLAGFLALIPAYTLIFLLAKYFDPNYIGALEGCDRVVLLLFTFILWRRNGIKLVLPDWLLLACFGLAVIRLFFSPGLLALLTDFNFIVAYAAGRVTALPPEQEKSWANRGVWIIAIISVIGLVEVLFVGEGPRTVLYLAVANGGTSGLHLDAAFHADQYFGLRESSTMFGPLQFAPLCMAALVIWWVYSRKIVPAILITAGLVCSVTRSAWLGTVAAITVLAALTGQGKRLLWYGAVALALFLAAIPILGLSDYLLSTKTGQDPSSQSHRESLLGGLEYTLAHPLGTGPGSVGKFAVKQDENAAGIEDTYLTLGAQYGIAALACFASFLLSILRLLWHERTLRAYTAIGIIVGFGTVMMFAALHDVFPLACWLWFPVGLAVRSASEKKRLTVGYPVVG